MSGCPPAVSRFPTSSRFFDAVGQESDLLSTPLPIDRLCFFGSPTWLRAMGVLPVTPSSHPDETPRAQAWSGFAGV
jgi:hypothetical protein